MLKPATTSRYELYPRGIGSLTWTKERKKQRFSKVDYEKSYAVSVLLVQADMASLERTKE